MSLKLAAILADAPKKKRNREEILALAPDIVYDDGRTKQCFKDECDINKIMARFEQTGTASHLTKNQMIYGDFSDYDFHEQLQKLTKGQEVFDDLPAEVRREFGQSPQKFFDYVNDPKNRDDLNVKLPGLAAPGTQLPKPKPGTEPMEAVKPPADPPAGSPPAKPKAPAE